jgi:hypothetical protein
LNRSHPTTNSHITDAPDKAQNRWTRTHTRALLWCILFAVLCGSLTYFFLDSHQQDGGYHFLFARWAWKYPQLFVGVWSRPLFTFLYAFPALYGFLPARLLTVLITLVTAWQTFRLASDLKLERAELTIPFLILQPSFFLISADTMTEPLFALVFVIALRLHTRGYVKLGMLVASMMILARPEGFFLGAMWGVWVLLDTRAARPLWRRIPETLLLATGAFVWWLAGYIITHDPRHIQHSWPPDWKATGSVYGDGPIWTYVASLPQIVGPLLLVPFIIGLVLLLKRRKLGTVTSSFLTLLILHSIFRAFGMFGSAGYPRYFVCVAPSIAIITLTGWNAIAYKLSRFSHAGPAALASVVITLSAYLCFCYVDAASWSRDAVAVADTYLWFRQHERPVQKLVWSQAYMCIAFDCDPMQKPELSSDRERTLELLREAPRGTLIFWDGSTGPSWYGVKADDIEAAGYTRLRSKSYRLDGWILKRSWLGYGGPREQEMHLLYKE